jgi:hypothetical protein
MMKHLNNVEKPNGVNDRVVILSLFTVAPRGIYENIGKNSITERYIRIQIRKSRGGKSVFLREKGK